MLEPINAWILIEEDKPEKVTAGGVIIPKGAKSKNDDQVIKEAIVLAISTDVENLLKEDGMTLRYKVGDRIAHYGSTGIRIDVHDKEDTRMFIKHSGVIALVKENIPEVVTEIDLVDEAWQAMKDSCLTKDEV